jgi:hypothetical protein
MVMMMMMMMAFILLHPATIASCTLYPYDQLGIGDHHLK